MLVVSGAVAIVAGALTGCSLPGDSVSGGMLASAGWSAHVDARSGPAGENPTGTAWIDGGSSLAPRWDVEVTCLHVSGKTAIVGFTGTHSTYVGWGERYPSAGLIRIVDGGGVASRLDSLEFASIEGEQDGPPIPGPATCSEYPGPFGPSRAPGVNQDGDLKVTDAKPLPTSKQQCANGGWRRYGFDEQSQCDIFVTQRARGF
jgi:hypothetical protein